MCGRYSFVPTQKQLNEQLSEVELPQPLQLRFNIAPTQLAYVISNDQPHTLRQMSWGLVPYWSRDGANSGKLINARVEGLLEKPSFRIPALRRHCLVPADSFYEWRSLPGKRKAPYRIRLQNGALLFMAGIWDEWKGDGQVKHSFSILTTTPNAEVAPLHDRMPVLLLSAGSRQEWLETEDPESIRAMLQTPAPNAILELYRVPERLNSAGAEGPDLHQPVKEEDDLTLF